jgi:hypothetical protein
MSKIEKLKLDKSLSIEKETSNTMMYLPKATINMKNHSSGY